jgi:hypothetical protein
MKLAQTLTSFKSNLMAFEPQLVKTSTLYIISHVD